MTSTLIARVIDVVSRPRTWNPAHTAPHEYFDYLDLSSVDQFEKRIVQARKTVRKDAPSRARQLVEAGDVLVSTVRPNLNGVALVPAELHGATASTGFCVLRPKAELVDSRYLFHWVKTPAFVEEMTKRATGASYPAVSDRIVLESSMVLPPVGEQRRIAEVLDRAEALRSKRRAALAQLDTLTQSIFLDLFGDPGRNPRKWPRFTLGQLVENGPQNGLYKPSTDYGSGVPIVRIDAFYDGAVTGLAQLKRVRISESDRLLYGLRAGDVLVNRVNSIEYLGKSALIPDLSEPTVFESNMMRFGVDRSRVAPKYLVEFLQSGFVKSQILTGAKRAVNQASINQQDLKRFVVNLPPLNLQEDFARRIAAVEKLKSAQRASLAELDALFASLQHRAFRGEL